MKIGVQAALGGNGGIGAVVEELVRAEELGLESAWLPHIQGFDALTVLALAGQRTRRIELGTNVVPTYPRHPSALAQQALTAQAATGGRLTLGIGLSHRFRMEGMLGFDWSRPVRHMREYLSCLRPLLGQERASFAGEEFRIEGYQLAIPDATPPPVLVAALGPQMLRAAGQLADGTAIWMGGPRYLAEHAVPTITAAAREAGRPAPRVLASLPVCVTDRAGAVRAEAATTFARYGQLPSYRAILDREGGVGPADVALIGDEEEVLRGLRALAEAGATDFAASVFAAQGEDPGRTYALLQRHAQEVDA